MNIKVWPALARFLPGQNTCRAGGMCFWMQSSSATRRSQSLRLCQAHLQTKPSSCWTPELLIRESGYQVQLQELKFVGISYAPPGVCQAIYGGIEGARYDATAQVWFVPCKSEVDIALQIKSASSHLLITPAHCGSLQQPSVPNSPIGCHAL
jgi:hypothetical protein